MLKVVIIGNSATGKTSIIHRATCDSFNARTAATLGASFSSHSVVVARQAFKLQIWDTAGQEKYRSMIPMYYRGAHAAIVVYAIDDLPSFESLSFWLNSLRQSADAGTLIVICGNKCDLTTSRAVPTEKGRDQAAAVQARFTEVSAMTGEGIAELFQEIPTAYLEQQMVREQIGVIKQVQIPEGRTLLESCC
jgi:small GTP-binding protein